MANNISRRTFFTTALLSGGAALGSSSVFGALCRLTPRQGEGPFYPEGDLHRDNDLTELLPGKTATGSQVLLTGKVLNPQCSPIADAVVEIWQAAYSGRYNHSQDSSNNPLDPNFQYWGRTRTNSKGAYLFKTIIPGHYTTETGHTRPPHIHVKVHAAGHYALTTQVYFDPMSFEDEKLAQLIARLNQGENVPRSLLVHYQGTPALKTGRFDFTVQPRSSGS